MGLQGAFGDRGATGGILLNGITRCVSPMRLPQHPMDHANHRARWHHWRTGLGPRLPPRCYAARARRPSFWPRGRDTGACAANQLLELTALSFGQLELLRSILAG